MIRRINRSMTDGQEDRRRMIAEHNDFLTWALTGRRPMPRIPTRSMRLGGFGELLTRPGARAAVAFWWERALARVRDRD